MLQFSVPVGRWFGVHVRAHASLFLLLAMAAGYSAVATGSLLRGVALWMALCAAVLVREVARTITAAYFGLSVRAMFLLPVGGVMALAQHDGALLQSRTRIISAVGVLANLLVALVLLGFAYGIDPHVQLLRQPWITIEHILRSAVWLQVIVGAVNLLPSTALPTRRLLRPQALPASAAVSPAPAPSPRSIFRVTSALSLALMMAGLIFGLLWPVLLGLTMLLVGYLNRAAGAGAAGSLSIAVRDVMLTEYKPLSASITLRDALRQTTHTAQELFPVLRGERLVGWVSRAMLAARLRTEGDGFLQGTMLRTFQAVTPGENIGEALRRATALGAGEFIPVVEDGAMVGLLTPASFERAVGQLRLTQTPVERDDA